MSRSLPWPYRGGFCSGSSALPQQGLRLSGNNRFTRLNIFSSPSPSKVLLDGASSSAAKWGESLSCRAAGARPQGEPGRLTQLQPPSRPWVWDQDRDQAGKPPASLALAAPSSETSEQNVPGRELETSLLLVADLKKTLHTPKTVPLAPPRPASGR